MKSYFLETPPKLIGFQPDYHWAQATHDIQGDSIVSFIAPRSLIRFQLDPEPKTDYVALHFLVEQFDITERELRLYQRLLPDTLIRFVGPRFVRQGIDLFSDAKQLSLTKTFWRPISSFYYLSLPIIAPAKKLSSESEKEWYDEVKFLALDVMQSFTNDLRAIQYGSSQ